MFLAQILNDVGGAARYSDLVERGASHKMLMRAREAGFVTRPLYGTYALPGTSRGVILAAAYRARLTCVSLCDEVGLPLLEHPRDIHLVVPRDRARRADDRRPIKGVVMHRDDELWERAARSPVAAAIDAASGCVDNLAQLALCDSALRLARMEREAILEFASTPSAQIRWLVDNADPRAHALTESYMRIWLKTAGFDVIPQYEIGPSHHCDLLVDGAVALEIDGKDSHLNERSFQDDRERDRAVIRRGLAPLRYTYKDLFGSRPADFVADVLAAKKLAASAAR